MDDYKEKYEAALEQARKELKTCGSMDCDAARLIFRLFPQLRESEDERIRKELWEYFHELELSSDRDFSPSFTIDHILAWLEKQKRLFESGTGLYYYNGEKTTYCGYPATKDNPYDFAMSQQKERGPLTKDEEYTLHRIIEYLEDETCPSEWISLLHDIYCLPYTKQIKQKPVEYLPKQKVFDIMNKLTNLSYSERIPIESEEYVKIHEITSDVNSLLNYPIKPVEWSEEDERILTGIIERGSSQIPPYEPALKEEQMEWLMKRLKSLRPIKPEWSEEDEKMFNSLRLTYGSYMEHIKSKCCGLNDADRERIQKECEKELEWIEERVKSLHPQPHWKPSEEQMEALLWCTAHLGGADHRVLAELYEHLKKL